MRTFHKKKNTFEVVCNGKGYCHSDLHCKKKGLNIKRYDYYKIFANNLAILPKQLQLTTSRRISLNARFTSFHHQY